MTNTTLTRMRDRAVTDRAELDRLLDDTILAHIAMVDEDGDPVVIPTAIARDGDRILVHGSTGSGWMRRAAAGRPVSVAVTELNGIIVARSSFENSFRYRSAVLFGTFTRLPGPEVPRALDVITERFLPGRLAEVRGTRRRELAATMVLSMPIRDWSLKISGGWPTDGADDVAGSAWAGVIPLRAQAGRPEPAPDLRAGIPVPESVRALICRHEPAGQAASEPPPARSGPPHDDAPPGATIAAIPLPERLNRRSGAHVVRSMGSMLGASVPRRSWFGIAGAALLVASGAIHLDLYLTGYRTIPTIGWLFLLQVIAAFALALAIPLTGSWLAAAAGAGFALSVLGGYLLSIWVGLFGFTEVRTTAGIWSGIIDVAAFATLALAAAPGLPEGLNLGRRVVPAVAAASVVAFALLGVAEATPKTQPVATGPDVLLARTVGGVNLLTNSKGLTVYWFAPDTPGKSACYGDCATYWPPVTGTPSAGSGVTGKLGTITRTGGTIQATYDGHPLYTYVGDSAPGQDGGNNLNLNGGLWHIVPVTG